MVGAGIAGAVAAWHLARRGAGPVTLFDREAQPGGHSTARNAAILRTAIPDPVLHRLASASMDFYLAPPAGFSAVPLVDPVGVLLAAPAAHADALLTWTRDPSCARGGREVDPRAVQEAHPYVGAGIAAAVSFDAEGVLDVDAILQAYLRGARAAGAELRSACAVEALDLAEDGSLRGLRTAEGDFPADAVVLAGGGWAAQPAAAAGLPLPLVPHRRHLMVTPPDARIDARAPVVWLQGEEFYFRPESGGMLMSACDHVPVTPADGERADAAVLETIAAKAACWLPGLEDAAAAHFWAGMRTFAASDQRFVVGPDPRLAGLHWAAGLGGHGITCGHAVGALAAALLLDPQGSEASGEPAAALAPARLLTADGAATGRATASRPTAARRAATPRRPS